MKRLKNFTSSLYAYQTYTDLSTTIIPDQISTSYQANSVTYNTSGRLVFQTKPTLMTRTAPQRRDVRCRRPIVALIPGHSVNYSGLFRVCPSVGQSDWMRCPAPARRPTDRQMTTLVRFVGRANSKRLYRDVRCLSLRGNISICISCGGCDRSTVGRAAGF